MLISITSDYNCVQTPRCSFCFLLMRRIIEKIEGKNEDFLSIIKLERAIDKYYKEEQENNTFCFEYNGFGLAKIYTLVYYAANLFKNKTLTMTTMPSALEHRSEVIYSALANLGFSAIALSLDSQKNPYNYDTKKYDTSSWEKVAKNIKKAGMKLSCNYLIEPSIGINIPTH